MAVDAEQRLGDARSSLNTALKLSQWARGNFKIARGGKEQMREAITRPTFAAYAAVAEEAGRGPYGPSRTVLDPESTMSALLRSCRESCHHSLQPGGGIPL
eukprot:8195978-Alexandrium_andersonii.AAC.1